MYTNSEVKKKKRASYLTSNIAQRTISDKYIILPKKTDNNFLCFLDHNQINTHRIHRNCHVNITNIFWLMPVKVSKQWWENIEMSLKNGVQSDISKNGIQFN